MSQMSQTEQIELSIAEAEKLVQRGKDVRALIENPLFKKIVDEGYFKDEAARLAMLMSDPGISEEIRNHVYRDINGPGAFRRYLQAMINIGNAAANELVQAREMLEEVIAEEAAE